LWHDGLSSTAATHKSLITLPENAAWWRLLHNYA
jgi:hypothetical protein